MNTDNVVEEAVKKAQANGWKPDAWQLIDDMYDVHYWPSIIYDHDFAKALWGDDECFIYVEYASENIDTIENYPQGSIDMKMYMFHLQQMVIADDPIKYLGDNI